MALTIVNWDKYQHYRNRRPPWVKLHRSLLDKPEWHALDSEAARTLIELWLIASECDDGVIDKNLATLAFRLRRASTLLARSLILLRDNDFIECDSDLLAECLQDASPETETEGEERQRESSASLRSAGAAAPTLEAVRA